MKFFVPEIAPEKQEDFHEGIHKWVENETGWKTTERRIRSLSYTHDGRSMEDTVGESQPAHYFLVDIAHFVSQTHDAGAQRPDQSVPLSMGVSKSLGMFPVGNEQVVGGGQTDGPGQE